MLRTLTVIGEIKMNIETARKAKKHLKNNGSLIIFPSGSVSTAKSIKSEAKDDEWKVFPAKLIHQTKTDILPIYFDGKNGLLFHLFASFWDPKRCNHPVNGLILSHLFRFLGESEKMEDSGKKRPTPFASFEHPERCNRA